MDDPERVRLGDGFASLQQESDCFVNRQRAAQAQDLTEIRALQVFHHHVGRAGFERPHVGHARDVLALNLHRRARLAREAQHGFPVLTHVRQQEFEREELSEL